MKKIVFIFLCLNMLSWAENKSSIKYALEYNKIDQRITLSSENNDNLKKDIKKVDEIKFMEAPKYISQKPLYFVLKLQDKTVNIILDESKGSDSGYDIAYVDVNCDGKISEEEKIATYVIEKNIMPVQGSTDLIDELVSTVPIETTFKLGGDIGVKYYFSIRYKLITVMGKKYINQITAVDSGWYTGEININGEKTDIAVFVDLLNLSVSEPLEKYIYDIYADIDKDKKYSFKYPIFGVEKIEKNESLYAGKKLLSIEFEKIENNCKNIYINLSDSAETKQFGELNVLNCDRYYLKLRNEEGKVFKIIKTGNPCILPADRYSVIQTSIEKTVDNVKWNLALGFKDNFISIENGKKFEIKDIAMIDYSFKISDTQDGFVFEPVISINGVNEKFAIYKNNNAYAPKFRIIDEKNKVIYTGQFQYG